MFWRFGEWARVFVFAHEKVVAGLVVAVGNHDLAALSSVAVSREDECGWIIFADTVRVLLVPRRSPAAIVVQQVRNWHQSVSGAKQNKTRTANWWKTL